MIVQHPNGNSYLFIDNRVFVSAFNETTNSVITTELDLSLPLNNWEKEQIKINLGNIIPDGFWSDVIRSKNFSQFFERYPKETESNPIPENWYMVITEENLEIAKKWQKEKSKSIHSNAIMKEGYLLLSYHPDDSYYFGSRNLDSFKNQKYFKDKNYKEITTEQFKKYILKKETTMTTTSQKILREAFESIYSSML